MKVELTVPETKTILKLAKTARKPLEELHNTKGTCKYCKYTADTHYWPSGTCPTESIWNTKPQRFSPSKALVTKYDSIIEKLNRR